MILCYCGLKNGMDQEKLYQLNYRGMSKFSGPQY